MISRKVLTALAWVVLIVEAEAVVVEHRQQMIASHVAVAIEKLLPRT